MGDVSREHWLKVWPRPFEDLRLGRKTYELRVNDRNFAVGDTLILAEYDSEAGFTGRVLRRRVIHVTTAAPAPLPPDVVVLGLETTQHLLVAASEGFRATGLQDQHDLTWWLRLLQHQTDEARQHLAGGDIDKALAEVADHAAVAWEILDRFTGDAAAAIQHRLEARILPRIQEIQLKDNEVLA